MLFRAGRVVRVLQFENLAFAQAGDRCGEEPGDLDPEPGGDLGGPGEQEVAGEDRLEVAPLRVDAGDGAARCCVVHHVVVVERAEVDQFD